MQNPDILVFMSDQHTPHFSSYMGGIAATPNLEKLLHDGASFNAAYTSCPLCVPARMSMLTGQLPSSSGIFTNEDTLPNTHATFVHSLAAVGYETTLAGRMHFIGQEQRHGFTNRLVGDTTPVTWQRPTEKLRETRGVYLDCYRDSGALEVMGGGNSPVLDYDEQVVTAAIDHLQTASKKPQFMLVGTYGPHFPYVAPPELYTKYLPLVKAQSKYIKPPENLPKLFSKRANYDLDKSLATRARAAYYGMIETIDWQVGIVRSAFEKHLERTGHAGIFVYLSDHGDQCGERGMFGKNTFFESSARIPMLFSGYGITSNKSFTSPASIMDLGPTLCDLAAALPPPRQAGESLINLLSGRPYSHIERAITSELIENGVLARMIRQGEYKYCIYFDNTINETLYNIVSDPVEQYNLVHKYPALVAGFRQQIETMPSPESVMARQITRAENNSILAACEKQPGAVQSRELWTNSRVESRYPPKVQ